MAVILGEPITTLAGLSYDVRLRLVRLEYNARQAGESTPHEAGEYDLCCWCVAPTGIARHQRTLWHLSYRLGVRFGDVKLPRRQQGLPAITSFQGHTPPRMRERRSGWR